MILLFLVYHSSNNASRVRGEVNAQPDALSESVLPPAARRREGVAAHDAGGRVEQLVYKEEEAGAAAADQGGRGK